MYAKDIEDAIALWEQGYEIHAEYEQHDDMEYVTIHVATPDEARAYISSGGIWGYNTNPYKIPAEVEVL